MIRTTGVATLVIGAVFAAGLIGTQQASATSTLYWWAASGATAQGGTGTWDNGSTATNWNTTTSGSANSKWTPNDGSVDAVFGGTAGTITLGDCVTANTLAFQVDGDCIGNSGTKKLYLAGTANIVVNAGDCAYVWRPIVGSAGLNKVGGVGTYGTNTGTLVLGAACTYTGNTVIDCGTLRLGISNALPSTTNLTLNAGGTLDMQGFSDTVAGVSLQGGSVVKTTTAYYILLSSATTFDLRSGTICNMGGNVGVYKTTPGTVTINGHYGTFTGQTVISDGAIVCAAADLWTTQGGAFGLNTLPIKLGDCSTTDVGGSPSLLEATQTINHQVVVSDCATTGTYTLGTTQTGGAVAGFAGLITLNNNVTLWGNTWGFQVAGGITGGASGPATKTVTVNSSGAQPIYIMTQPISDGASKLAVYVNSTGGGGTQFNVGSTYSGGTLISRATTLAGANNAFGTGSITLGDCNTSTGNYSPTLKTNGAYTVDRPITIADCVTTGTYTLGGAVDALSTFSGPITVNRPLTIVQVANTGSNALNITGGITSGNTGSKVVTFTPAATGVINVNTTGMSDGGGGTVAPTVTAGTVTFNVASSYTGVTSISGGKLIVPVDGALGSTSGGTTISSTGRLVFRNVNYATAEPITVSTSATQNNPSIVADSGASSFAGNLGAAALNPYIQVATGSSLTLSGQLSGSGGAILNTDTSATTQMNGTLYLTGDSSATKTSGGITVDSGILNISNSGALGSSAVAFTVGNNASAPATAPELQLQGGITLPQTQGNFKDFGVIRNVSGANSIPNGLYARTEYTGSTAGTMNHFYVDCGTLTIGAISNNTGATSPVTLVLGGALGGGGVGTLSGIIGQNSATNYVAVNVNGAKWYLNGANTYTGPTTVTGGATLGGAGSFLSPITVNGGNFSPGTSPGKITLRYLNFTSSVDNCIMEIASAHLYDNVLFRVSVNLVGAGPTLGANLILNDAAYKSGAVVGDKFWILYSDNATSLPITTKLSYAALGNLDNGEIFTSVASGIQYQINYDISGSGTGSNNNVELVTMSLPAAPEPATLFLMGTGALGVIAFIRRQRMK